MSQAGICKYIVQGLYVTTCRQACAGMKVFARRMNRDNGTHICTHTFAQVPPAFVNLYTVGCFVYA